MATVTWLSPAYVNHDQTEAMTLADRIVVMNQGRVEQVGASLELYENPVNHFVAGFIGSPEMNFMTGRIEGGAFRSAAGVSLRARATSQISEGCEVICGMRPQHSTERGEQPARRSPWSCSTTTRPRLTGSTS